MYPLTNLMRFTFSLLIIGNQILKSKIRLNFLVSIGRNQYFYITFDHNEKINLALMYKNYIYIYIYMAWNVKLCIFCLFIRLQ